MRLLAVLVAAACLADGPSAAADEPVATASFATDQPGATEAISGTAPPPQAVGFELTSYVCPTGGYCDSPCAGCRQSRMTGWSAAVEIGALHPSLPASTLRIDEEEVGLSLGVVVGHEGPRGGGIRARFWGLDTDELLLRSSTTPAATATAELDVAQLDVDFYQRLWVGDTSLVVGVGPRAAYMQWSFMGLPSLEASAAGGGVSVELRRAFYRTHCSEVALIGTGELSLMTGEYENNALATVTDETMTIAEVGFGVEGRRRWRNGDLLFRYLFETQAWDAAAFGEVGLTGSRFQVGYQW